MEQINSNYTFAGFFASATMSAIHFQDIFMAFTLGFVGAIGGYAFKCLKEWFEKKKKVK